MIRTTLPRKPFAVNGSALAVQRREITLEWQAGNCGRLRTGTSESAELRGKKGHGNITQKATPVMVDLFIHWEIHHAIVDHTRTLTLKHLDVCMGDTFVSGGPWVFCWRNKKAAALHALVKNGRMSEPAGASHF